MRATCTCLESCLICGTQVRQVLDLGLQPLANSLLPSADTPYDTYPLGLSVCPNCAHGQLTHAVDPGEIFVDYLYASGTSQTLRDFFTWFSDKIAGALGTGIEVLELASNDGSLLDALRAAGLDPMGIDPAANLCKVAEAKGHRVQCGFFPQVKPNGPVDLIVAMNVLAHTPNPSDFMRGVSDCLKPGGMALVQTSQANMIANGEFDTIYHEHYSFYSAPSMAALARSAGLELERVELVSVHGTSFLFTLRKPGGVPLKVDFAGSGEGSFHVPMPDPMPDLFNPDCPQERAQEVYRSFAVASQDKMHKTAELMQSHVAQGRSIGLVGVAAKALTFIHASGIKPRYFFDEAPLKIGRYVPGSDVGIMPLADLAKLDEDVVLLIGAWNFAAELNRKIQEKVKDTPMQNRLSVIVYQPELKRL